jgi:hypothetical protein
MPDIPARQRLDRLGDRGRFVDEVAEIVLLDFLLNCGE